MSCDSCNGGGSAQPFGKGSSRAGATPGLTHGGDYTSIKWFPTEKYNYRGGKLYPDPLPNSFPRQASNYWAHKDEACNCGFSSGFVGERLPDGTIRRAFVGLPGSCGQPVRRPTQFRRPYKFWDNVTPPVPNGRQAVARQLCSVPAFTIYRPVQKGETCRPAHPNGEYELETSDDESSCECEACRGVCACRQQRKRPQQQKMSPECLARTQPTLREKGAVRRRHRALCRARKQACVPSRSNGGRGAVAMTL